MFIGFLLELRRFGVPVGTQEMLTLAEALQKGLHGSTLDGFYELGRAVLIHRESHLDAYDQAFLKHFHNARIESIKMHQDLLDWLKEAAPLELPEDWKWLEEVDPEELRREFEDRLREQDERHDGGSKWIGTGGRSPFGHSGAPRPGIRVGGTGKNRSAIHVAGERRFKGYRNDRQMDVRQWAVALRKLRNFHRHGQEEELDVDGTIDATARNAGDLEVITRPPRRPNTRVILLLDVGGSMDPYVMLVEQLFSAAASSSHFKEFRSYFFHNCIYGKLFKDEHFRESITLRQLLGECGPHYRLIIVGDAAMAPYELFHPKGSYFFGPPQEKTGWDYMTQLAAHYPRTCWLNPDDPRYWQGPGSTREALARLFPMYPLTLDGLTEAIAGLNGTRPASGSA
ncbi:VWA domain-containing protein [bacterium]|nr:VWA domain-containing protein [bacterium]